MFVYCFSVMVYVGSLALSLLNNKIIIITYFKTTLNNFDFWLFHLLRTVKNIWLVIILFKLMFMRYKMILRRVCVCASASVVFNCKMYLLFASLLMKTHKSYTLITRSPWSVISAGIIYWEGELKCLGVLLGETSGRGVYRSPCMITSLCVQQL